MTDNVAPARIPIDTRVRDRLQAEQRRESAALLALTNAERALARARAKRDSVVQAAAAKVDHAQDTVRCARAQLAAVSGIERAAVILGIDAADLRRDVAAARLKGPLGKRPRGGAHA